MSIAAMAPGSVITSAHAQAGAQALERFRRLVPRLGGSCAPGTLHRCTGGLPRLAVTAYDLRYTVHWTDARLTMSMGHPPCPGVGRSYLSSATTPQGATTRVHMARWLLWAAAWSSQEPPSSQQCLLFGWDLGLHEALTHLRVRTLKPLCLSLCWW